MQCTKMSTASGGEPVAELEKVNLRSNFLFEIDEKCYDVILKRRDVVKGGQLLEEGINPRL